MMAEDTRPAVYGGVDTHADVHVAAAVDFAGRVLGTWSFPVTPDGYAQLLDWLRSRGGGLARHLAAQGVQALEVTRPDRQRRRRNGKSDPVDAVSAAMAALRMDD